MMHQVEHSKTTNVSPNHKRPFHRDESCNDEEEEDGINHLDDLSEMSLMNRSNIVFLNDNSSNMNRTAKEHNNHEGSSSSSVPMMMANNHESTILEPPRKKKISHSHSDHHSNNNYPISSSIHENQQESSHREHMMTLPNHKFQKLFSQPNSIFQLIFKNQWKTLYEFIEELFSKYSWIHSTSEISQHVPSIHDTQQFEKISQPSTTISLKQRLQHLSPKYIQMLNQHFIAIPPDAPNLELTLSKAALEYSQECSSVRVPSLMSDHPSVRVPSLRDESSILLSNPHFHLSFRQTCNISELVDRIIESIFAETSSQNEKPKHVLCFGFAKIRPNAAHGISTMTTVQSFFPNSIIDIVKSQEWEILLSLVGDCVMSYILRYCIVLKGTIPRNSFLQICGKPLYHYCNQNLKEKKKPLALHSLKLFQEFEEIMKDERELYNENDHLRNSHVMMMNVRSDIHELDHHHAYSSSSSNSHSLLKKLSTLSHEKEEEELEEEMHEQDDHDPSKPLLLVSESALHSLFLEELEDQQHLIDNPIHATTTTTTTTKTTTETQDDRMVLEFHDEHVEDDHVVMHVIPPRRQRRHQRQRNGNDTYSISECFIPRQVMFYSNKKTPVLGFPQKHMFNTMERSIEGAKKLFNFIFYGKREQPDKRHVKGYGFLLELLLEMKYCQVKHLKSTPYRLSHYCPLKRIQKKKIISNTISISHAEQPLLYKKIEDKNINKHGSSNMVLRMEQLLCTQEENDGTMMVMDTLNSSRTVRDDDDADTNSNSRNITIAPQIESEVMLNSSEQFENLVNMTQSYDKVSQFIKSTCKKLIPFELFGSQHNMNVIFHNIDRIVSLGRYETLTLHELMQNIKVNDMKWTIRNPSKNSTTAISTITAHSSHRSVDVLQFKKQTFMAQQFILFLFKHIIMVLLSTHFYITESDQHRTKLLYFRRETWEYINRVSWSKINNQDSSCDFLHGNEQEIVETMNRGNNLQQIETQQEPQQPQQPQQPQLLPQQDHTYSTLFKPIEKDLALQLLKKKSLPYTSVRLLPKQNTARPIINLGKRVMNSNAVSSTTTATTNTKNDFLNPNTSEFNSHSYSINSKLRDLLSVLKFETNRNPELLGSSVFNPLDMYKRLLPFVRMWKEQVHHVSEKLKIFENKENLMLLQQEHYSTPSNNDDDLHLNTQLLPLYIVKIDIKGAYDSIPHQKLFHLISNSIIREDEYISVKYHVIRPYIGKLISKYERVIMCPNQFMRFTKLLNSQLSHKYCKSIFIDQVSYTSVHSNDMNMLLKEHISQNLIKIKNEFYIQVIGIPQGSIVSPLLCSLLYADFERVCLSHDLPGMHSSGGNNGSGSGSGSCSTSHSDLKNSHSSGIVLSSLESMMIGTTSGSSSSTCSSSSHNSTSRRNNHVGNAGSASASHSSQHDVNKDGTWNYFSNDDSTLKYFIHVLNSNAAATTTTLTTCESHERVDSSSTTLFTATSVHHDTATTTTTTTTATTTTSHGTNFVLTPPISFMKRELVPLFSPIVEPLLHKSHLSTSTSNSSSSSMNDHHSNSSRTRQNGAQVLSLPQYLISSPPVVFQKEAGQILSPPLPQHEDTVSLSNSSNSSLILVPSIGVLLRLIDDFLYITNNKNAAQYFLERMHTGNPEYGIKINPKKTKVNFETSVKLTSLTLCEYHAEHLIRWCGFNIDTQTLNITVDYSRYWDCHLKDKISRDCRTPGFNLCRKLKQTISWKCTPLVIDGTINSRFTCYLNVYQLFLFVAMKFHTTIRHKMKPQWDKKNLAHMKSAYNLCKTTISDIVGYTWICIQSRKKVIHKFGSFCELEKLYVQYLGVCAFHKILQRKHSHYVPFEILTQLRIVKRNLLASMEETGTKQLMKRVTERRFSTELLNHIQF